jgi:hypothetical protein
MRDYLRIQSGRYKEPGSCLYCPVRLLDGAYGSCSDKKLGDIGGDRFNSIRSRRGSECNLDARQPGINERVCQGHGVSGRDYIGNRDESRLADLL